MFFRTIVAAFFVAQSSTGRTLHRLASDAGMTERVPLTERERAALGLHEPDREAVYGQWGAFGDAWAIVDPLDRHDCLQIYSSMNRFLDAQPDRSAENGAPPVDWMLSFVQTFRDACTGLGADVAFLDTRAHYGDERWENKQGNRDWVLARYWMVLESDANALADERFALLYLSEPMTRLWVRNPTRDDRDMVPLPNGRLVFARSGPARMA
jgi:hypothetical protein